MRITHESMSLPDSISVASQLEFAGAWEPEAVDRLIRSKCDFGESPAFLFLGKKEAALLREHLSEVFGIESVTTLHDTYYMGLEVVEIACESFLFAGGRKMVRTLQDPISSRPAWRDRETDAGWQFRF